jgi:hypothetical protein
MKKHLFTLLGIVFSTVPPLWAVLSYFPVWASRGSAEALSGFTLFLILISVLPFYKKLREILKSPSVTVIWLLLFVLFFMLSKISDEMIVISFIGFIGNLIGTVFFKLGRSKI